MLSSGDDVSLSQSYGCFAVLGAMSKMESGISVIVSAIANNWRKIRYDVDLFEQMLE